MKRLLTLSTLFIVLPVVASNQVAIFAGGCFWCMQSDFDKFKGVVKTTVGYDGGTIKNPTYQLVSSGSTHYVESMKVVFNPKVISYKQLLNYYWKQVDPTVQNQQFCDHGEQYRTVVYTLRPLHELAHQRHSKVSKFEG